MHRKLHRRLTLGVLLAVVVGALAATPALAHASTIQFGSSSEWTTFTQDPGATSFGRTPIRVGPAQQVCMTSIAPPTCSEGATVYNSPFYGWTADLTPIPGAAWIWAPGIDGNSATADLAHFFFSKTFVIPGHPNGGTIYVSADDYAAVLVNGSLVGTIGSIVDPGLAGTHVYLTSFDLTGFLKPGRNVITIEAQNGPAYFSGLCSGPCTYALNPAGVVFGGSLVFEQGA